MSTLTVQNIQGSSSNGNTISVASGHVLNAPGHIIQTKSVSITDVFSTSSTTYVDITGLSVDITPSSASSKILITGSIAAGCSSYYFYVNLLRNGTEVGQGVGVSNRPGMFLGTPYYGSGNDEYSLSTLSPNFLDSPNTTSAITYKCQCRTYSSSVTGYINRTSADRDYSLYEPRGRSNLTVQEIAQ